MAAARDQIHLHVHSRGAGDVHAPIQHDLGDAAVQFFRGDLHFLLPFCSTGSWGNLLKRIVPDDCDNAVTSATLRLRPPRGSAPPAG